MTTPPLDVPSSGPARSVSATAVGDPRTLTIASLQRPAATCSIHLLTICSVLLSSSVAYGTSGCNAGARRRAARGPAPSLRAGAAAPCIDPPRSGRLAALGEATGGTEVATLPCPTQQCNARDADPSPASQHTADHARRDNAGAPKQRWSAKLRQPLRSKQRWSVDTTVCAPLRRHSTVVSAVWAGQHCPSSPFRACALAGTRNRSSWPARNRSSRPARAATPAAAP